MTNKWQATAIGMSLAGLAAAVSYTLYFSPWDYRLFAEVGGLVTLGLLLSFEWVEAGRPDIIGWNVVGGEPPDHDAKEGQQGKPE